MDEFRALSDVYTVCKISEWAKNNCIKLNIDNCKYLISNVNLKMCDKNIINSKVDYLGITLNNKLNFESHINKLFTRMNRINCCLKHYSFKFNIKMNI